MVYGKTFLPDEYKKKRIELVEETVEFVPDYKFLYECTFVESWLDSEDVVTEGANIEMTKILKQNLKSIKDNIKAAKGYIKAKDYKNARAKLKDAKSDITKTRKEFDKVKGAGEIGSVAWGALAATIIMTLELLVPAYGMLFAGIYGGRVLTMPLVLAGKLNSASAISNVLAVGGAGGAYAWVFVKGIMQSIELSKEQSKLIKSGDPGASNTYKIKLLNILGDITKRIEDIEDLIDKKEKKDKEK